MIDYTIAPVLMGGLIKEVTKEAVKIHIHGRLGVITIAPEYITSKEPLCPGHELSFYFSYLRVTTDVFAMDLQGMRTVPPFPSMVYGTIAEVNDTAIRAQLAEGIGTVAVPLRFVFTDVPLQVGQTVELYLSNMEVVGYRDIPIRSI